MYNAKYVWIGIVFFLVLFTLPFTLNIGSDKYVRPEVAVPVGVKDCIESAEYMRAEHMTMLNTWRDMALREDKREYVASDGRKWVVSLQNTCTDCHANKAEFCDKCHESNSVTPYCWDCHVEPKGNQ